MPFKPGHGKIGGRPKGSKNKRDASLQEKAKELGVDPFEVLLLFSKGDWKALGYDAPTKKAPNGVVMDVISADLRVNAAKEASQYIYAKRKSIEHSGLDGNPIEVEIFSVDQIKKMAKAIADE